MRRRIDQAIGMRERFTLRFLECPDGLLQDEPIELRQRRCVLGS